MDLLFCFYYLDGTQREKIKKMHKKINFRQKCRFCVIFVTFNDAILDAFALIAAEIAVHIWFFLYLPPQRIITYLHFRRLSKKYPNLTSEVT